MAGAPPVDPVAFRRLMARWATGVAVVSAHESGADAGLTVNALLSVSLAPPTLLVSVTHDADATPVIRRTHLFAVSLLAADQRPLSERFARVLPGAEKFRDVPVHRGTTGLALLDGALGWFECRVRNELQVEDHLLLVGDVLTATAGQDGLPLLFFRSHYAQPGAGGLFDLNVAPG